jgi:hypothetical protein
VRRALLAAIACTALVALIAPAAAPAAPASDVTAAAKKKRCKKGQVRVRSGKRVSCVRARQVLPKPKRGDPRLLLARSAFGRDWSRVRSRRGKRAQSLPKLVRKLGPRAPRLLSRVTARGLGVIDRHAVTAARAHSAATGCRDVPPGARQQDSFTSSAGGVRATVTSTVGSDGAQLGMELTGNEFTLSAELDFGACEPNEVEAPQCPTAAGQLSGEIRYKMRVSIKVSRGGENVWSQSAEITRRTKLEGFTDVDAKLDFLDVEDNEVSTVRLGGSTRAFPPISIRTRLTRNTRVNMRTGAYEPGLSDITVTVDMEGLFGADRSDLQDQLEQRGRGDADQQFRSVIEKAMSGYRNREERWQQPGVCAKLELVPTPGSLTLKPDQAGTFTATAKAVQDGNASELDARLSEQVGAAFEPTRAGGQQARFGYTVHHGTRDRVAVKVRATSKAGVAEGTWEQPVEPPPPPPPSAYNGTFSGTGVYDENELGSGNHMNASWSGSFHATWSGPSSPGASDASYTFQSGTVQYSFNGRVGDCDVAGNGTINLGEQPDYQNLSLIHLFFDSPPRKYQLQVPAPLIAQVAGTQSDCENPDENGDEFDWSPGAGVPWFAYSPYPGGPVADDWSIHGSGSGNTGPGSPEQTWQWQLTAVP